MEIKKRTKKDLKRQQRYDEMIAHQPEIERNWMKEKPYQLRYKERVTNEQCTKEEEKE